jgi:hypothetical protein
MRLLAEESIVVRLHVVPHRCRLEVSRARLQVFIALVIVQRDPQTGSIRNLDVALLDNGLLQTVDQILPEWHIEGMVLQRQEPGRGRSEGRTEMWFIAVGSVHCVPGS